MKTIFLAAPWVYRTPLVTMEYAAGEHSVSDDIAAQARKEKRIGRRTAKAGSARAAARPQG